MKDIKGKKFGLLTVLEYVEPAKSRGKHRWKCLCDCGTYSIVQDNHLKTGNTKSCGCLHARKGKNSPFFKGVGEMGMDYFSVVKRGAVSRHLIFKISIEDAWQQFIKQNRKCALTGLELSFGENQTASLDRIDSKKGYTIDNIQWVHKHINIMKNDLDSATFFMYCKLINENQSSRH